MSLEQGISNNVPSAPVEPDPVSLAEVTVGKTTIKVQVDYRSDQLVQVDVARVAGPFGFVFDGSFLRLRQHYSVFGMDIAEQSEVETAMAAIWTAVAAL